MSNRVLHRSVSSIHPKLGAFSYPAGTRESDMPKEVVEHIRNPKAWVKREVPDDDFVQIPEGLTREDFIAAAKANAERRAADVEAEGDEDELDGMTIPGLREHAADHGIELGDATKKEQIIKKIREAQTASGEGTSGEPDGAGNT